VSADLERLAAEFERFQAKIRQAEVNFGGVAEMQEQVSRLEVVATSPTVPCGWSQAQVAR
jgi:hypothetical protein